MTKNFIYNYKFVNYEKKEDLQDKTHVSRKNKSLIHSLEKLVCKYHDKTKFIVDGQIPNSTVYDRLSSVKDRKPSNTYICDKCNKETSKKENLDEKSISPTKYYECFFCQGYILGEPIKKYYYPSKEMKKLGFNEDKINYHCNVCNNVIGYELMNVKKKEDK